MRPPLLSRRVRTRSRTTPEMRAQDRSTLRQRAPTRFSAEPNLVKTAVMGVGFMTYLVEGVAPVTPAVGVAVGPEKPSDSSLRPMESTFAAGSGKSAALTI
jgi:hypothetical protein